MAEEHRPVPGSANSGIQLFGNARFQAGAVAVGPGASASAEMSGASLADEPALLAELRTRVEELLAMVRAEADERADAVDALVAVDEGAAELAKERPVRSVVAAAFERAAAGIASAGAVAGNLQVILNLLGVR